MDAMLLLRQYGNCVANAALKAGFVQAKGSKIVTIMLR